MLRILDRLEEWFVTFLMAAATLVVFAAVLHRYSAGLPIPWLQDWLLGIHMSWAQELCVEMFVWMAFFSAAYGVRIGIHVGVDVITRRLHGKPRAALLVFGMLAGALFASIICYLGAYFVWENGLHHALFSALGRDVSGIPEGPTTPDLESPTWVVYSAVQLGFGMICFRFLQAAYNFVTTGRVPRHDDSHVEGLEEELQEAERTLGKGNGPGGNK